MKVYLDRNSRVVYVQEASPKWACWAGYYLAANYPHLNNLDGWNIFALDAGDSVPSSASEQHGIRDNGSCAGEIYFLIKNPPKPPHNCPDCKCPPKDCCR